MPYPLSRQLTYDAYESPFYRSHCSLTVTPHKLYFGLQFIKNYSLHTCTTGYYYIYIYIYMSKTYLSICRNPLYFTMSRSQIRFTFTWLRGFIAPMHVVSLRQIVCFIKQNDYFVFPNIFGNYYMHYRFKRNIQC